MEIVQEGCCVACGSLLNRENYVVRIPFVLWWGANSGCESPSETHANELSQPEFAPNLSIVHLV